MIRVTQRYQTSDGSLFQCLEEAENYEVRWKAESELRDFLTNWEFDDTYKTVDDMLTILLNHWEMKKK